MLSHDIEYGNFGNSATVAATNHDGLRGGKARTYHVYRRYIFRKFRGSEKERERKQSIERPRVMTETSGRSFQSAAYTFYTLERRLRNCTDFYTFRALEIKQVYIQLDVEK